MIFQICLKGLKLLGDEIILHVKNALFSTDNSHTSRLSIFYRISNHKNFFSKYLYNALTDFT